MIQEQYTIILKHDAVYDENIIQLDQPLVIRYIVDHRFGSVPILLNRMMDEMKDELIQKACKQ